MVLSPWSWSYLTVIRTTFSYMLESLKSSSNVSIAHSRKQNTKQSVECRRSFGSTAKVGSQRSIWICLLIQGMRACDFESFYGSLRNALISCLHRRRKGKVLTLYECCPSLFWAHSASPGSWACVYCIHKKAEWDPSFISCVTAKNYQGGENEVPKEGAWESTAWKGV